MAEYLEGRGVAEYLEGRVIAEYVEGGCGRISRGEV